MTKTVWPGFSPGRGRAASSCHQSLANWMCSAGWSDRCPVAGSGPSRPGPSQQLPAYPIQLTDVAPPEAAQERPQGGWRLDHTGQNPGRPASAQRVGVVNAVAASQRRRHQGHHLVARIGSARRMAQVEAPLNQLGEAKVQGQCGRQDQPSIGHQAVVIKGDLDTVGVVAW